jgi:hypothetical protein
MAELFAQSARRHLEDDRLAEAAAAVEQGLLVNASNSALLSLRREVQQRLEQAKNAAAG